jgi:hypothetical protein
MLGNSHPVCTLTHSLSPSLFQTNADEKGTCWITILVGESNPVPAKAGQAGAFAYMCKSCMPPGDFRAHASALLHPNSLFGTCRKHL